MRANALEQLVAISGVRYGELSNGAAAAGARAAVVGTVSKAVEAAQHKVVRDCRCRCRHFILTLIGIAESGIASSSGEGAGVGVRVGMCINSAAQLTRRRARRATAGGSFVVGSVVVNRLHRAAKGATGGASEGGDRRRLRLRLLQALLEGVAVGECGSELRLDVDHLRLGLRKAPFGVVAAGVGLLKTLTKGVEVVE